MRPLTLLALLVVGCFPTDRTPAGLVGDPCILDPHCTQTGAVCVKEAEHATWVGGYCVVSNCSSTSCPSGSFCQMGGTALGMFTCLKTCTTAGDCRTGYMCCPTTAPTGGMVCAPPKAGNLCP